LPAPYRNPAVVSAIGPGALVAIEAVPVVHGDLDLRASFGDLPRVHTLGASHLRIGPYAPEAETPRGTLVDRYV
jgi:hypothetical protein